MRCWNSNDTGQYGKIQGCATVPDSPALNVCARYPDQSHQSWTRQWRAGVRPQGEPERMRGIRNEKMTGLDLRRSSGASVITAAFARALKRSDAPTFDPFSANVFVH